jgi:hypothetical protein
MAHMLAKLRDVDYSDVKQKLAADAPGHAEHGMHLEHLWSNADDPKEVLFLFRVDDLDHCRRLMQRVQSQARLEDPSAKLPETTFLDGQ